MISKTELKSIDAQYFNVLQMGCFTVYLQSKNTKHFWGIHVAEYTTFRNFKVYHKHNSHDPYHRHKDARNLKVAIEQIKSHDSFQLNGRKSIKEKVICLKQFNSLNLS